MTHEIWICGVLRAVGAFYALGSVFVLWGTLTSALVEQATAAIKLKPLSAAAIWRARWLAGSALLLLACGLSLIMLLSWAVPLFLLSTAGQALYLAVLAPRFFDPVDKPEAADRQGTRNALVVFAVVTALVLAVGSAGWLKHWRDHPEPILAGVAGLWLFAAAYTVVNLRSIK